MLCFNTTLVKVLSTVRADMPYVPNSFNTTLVKVLSDTELANLQAIAVSIQLLLRFYKITKGRKRKQL